MPSAAAAAIIAGPLAFLVARAAADAGATLSVLVASRTLRLLASTLALAGAASLLSVAVGATLAFLVERTDLPWRGLWRVALALPLAVPPYIGAIAYLHLLSRGGMLDQVLGVALPPHGLGAAAAVIALFTYPYSFLLTSAALRRQSRSLDEVARTAGLSPARVLFTVTLPLVRPAIGAGLFFPALYALADFGTVVLLRYETLATELYYLLTALYDRAAAAALGVAAMALTLAFVWVEGRLRGRGRRHPTDASWKPAPPLRLGQRRPLALLAPTTTITLALIIPVALLVSWAAAGVTRPSAAEQMWAASATSPWRAAAASLFLGVASATVIVTAAVPPAYLRARWPSPASSVIWTVAQSGFALPGVVVVLGVAFLTNTVAPLLYGTLPVMIGAFAVRYMSQALRAVEAGLTHLPPRLGEAARGLGESPIQVFRRIDVPLLRPSLVAGWAFVFLNVLKDLPVSLLLRPAGFDTLPVRTWLSATDGIYTQAALPALLLIACAAVPLTLLLRGGGARRLEAP